MSAPSSNDTAIPGDIPKAVEAIMNAYSYTPNFEVIVNVLMSKGIDGLAGECNVQPGK